LGPKILPFPEPVNKLQSDRCKSTKTNVNCQKVNEMENHLHRAECDRLTNLIS